MCVPNERDRAQSTDERFERAVQELLATEDRSRSGGSISEHGAEPRGNGDLDNEALDRSREVFAGVLGR